MNLPEDQWRSWRPRRPSPKLKRRIFAHPSGAPQVVLWSLRCLAPSLTCLLLAIAALKQGSTVTNPNARRDWLLGMIGSNQITYLPGNYQQEQNRCASVTFDWTNRSGSTSSISSFPPGKLN